MRTECEQTYLLVVSLLNLFAGYRKLALHSNTKTRGRLVQQLVHRIVKQTVTGLSPATTNPCLRCWSFGLSVDVIIFDLEGTSTDLYDKSLCMYVYYWCGVCCCCFPIECLPRWQIQGEHPPVMEGTKEIKHLGQTRTCLSSSEKCRNCRSGMGRLDLAEIEEEVKNYTQWQ